MNSEEQRLGIDYLNQIAPQEQKKGFTLPTNMKVILPIVGGVFALIIGVTLVSNVLQQERARLRELDERLFLRMENLQRELTAQRMHVRDNLADAATASLITQMSTFLTDLRAHIDVGAISERVRMSELEYALDLREDFRQARMMANFDQMYPQQLVFELTVLMNMIEEVHGSAEGSRPAYATILARIHYSLEMIRDQFELVE
ncbi:hypothetical protein FWD07_03195 [Candidatus Saccharibacteria bacterium]|nr:hypothetical protein [Candidatus Saccharibacteria bacterium]